MHYKQFVVNISITPHKLITVSSLNDLIVLKTNIVSANDENKQFDDEKHDDFTNEDVI